MGLPKHIIKKYGVTKKAWAVYKGNKTQSKAKTKTRSVVNVAKKRTRFKKARRYGRKLTKMSNPIQMDAMIYGGLRAKLSNLLSPITSKVPLGTVADEVVMGAVAYLVAKKTKGITRNIALKGLVIENARIGEAVADGSIMGALGGSTEQSSGNIF